MKVSIVLLIMLICMLTTLVSARPKANKKKPSKGISCGPCFQGYCRVGKCICTNGFRGRKCNKPPKAKKAPKKPKILKINLCAYVQCDPVGSKSCNKNTGKCKCKRGFKGVTCATPPAWLKKTPKSYHPVKVVDDYDWQ